MSEFSRAQLLIYRYVQSNLTQFVGEGVNNSGNVQLYFRVGGQIMVVAVSRDLYPSLPEFSPDSRPVRSIITVYFITEQEMKRFLVK